jgi:hypothetical protein
MKSIPFGLALIFSALTLFAQSGDPARVLEVIEGLRSGEGTRFELTEDDVNAYADQAVRQQPQAALKRLEIDFQAENRILARALVDMDELRLGESEEQLLGSMLSGRQTLEAAGVLEVTEGKGTYTIESATLNGVSVPPFLVNYLLSYYSASNPPNVDVTEPFELPFGIKDIRTSADRMLLTR